MRSLDMLDTAPLTLAEHVLDDEKPRHAEPNPQKVLDRLKQGPASIDDLARVIWGEEWDWPLTYNNAVRVYICWLRKKYDIGTTTLYTLE